MARTDVVIDMARYRAQMERATKRLYAHAEGILLDQQETLADRIREKAPEGPSGKLRKKVFVEVVNSKHGPVLLGGVKDLPYPVFVEFGTRYMQPQPFLRPAIQEMGGFIRRRRKGRR